MGSENPSNTLIRLARRLFVEETAQSRFINAVLHPLERPTAVVWTHQRVEPNPFDVAPPTAWQPNYVDLVPIAQRPGRHAVHTAGDIYCLDPSSVFLAQVMTAVSGAELIVDVCAAPGGKAILAWRRFQPRRLICNEVIGKRTAALIANLRRCRVPGAEVTSRDSSRLAEDPGAIADLVIVDAPCSGQSLLARGKPSPGCFHPATINMNSNRQRRILANAVRLVAPGGFLAYMTCTWSLKENERNVEWLLRQNPGFEPVDVPLIANFASPLSEVPCYRMWPDDPAGAGGFAALIRRLPVA